MDDDQLTLTICRILGAINGWNFDESGDPYPADQVAVFYGRIEDTPDRAVGVTVYGGDDPRFESTRRVQLRMRGGKLLRRDANQIAQAAFKVLHERIRGDGLSSVNRISFGPLGTDTNGRVERSDNYDIILENQEF